jgi:hypothetical protein
LKEIILAEFGFVLGAEFFFDVVNVWDADRGINTAILHSRAYNVTPRRRQ